jgi:hypothetical protein
MQEFQLQVAVSIEKSATHLAKSNRCDRTRQTAEKCVIKRSSTAQYRSKVFFEYEDVSRSHRVKFALPEQDKQV